MHPEWRRNVQQEKARRKRTPLVAFNGEVRPETSPRYPKSASKPQWHRDRARRFAGPGPVSKPKPRHHAA